MGGFVSLKGKMKQNKTWRGFLSQEEDSVAQGILVRFCSQQGLLAARSREKSLSHLQADPGAGRSGRWRGCGALEALPCPRKHNSWVLPPAQPCPRLQEENWAKKKVAGETATQTLGAHGTPKGGGLARRCAQLMQAS